MGMVEELIRDLREDLAGMRVSKDLFQNRFNNAIEDMIRGIFLTSDGELLYPTVETQAAQLLYSAIKSRPFLVGNNSLAVSLFIKFLEINQYLVDEHGDCVLDNSLLLSLSKPGAAGTCHQEHRRNADAGVLSVEFTVCNKSYMYLCFVMVVRNCHSV